MTVFLGFRRAGAFAALLAAVLLGNLVVPTAQAAVNPQVVQLSGPSCYGSSCTDRDPDRTTCAKDARTIWSKDAKGYGVLEMRFSPSCFSNWVRFTAYSGFRATLANLLAKGVVFGKPWIWRSGVSNIPRGVANSSAASVNPFTAVSSWTAMITAAGTTCMSVDLYQGGSNGSGSYSVTKIDSYRAGCVS